MFDLIISCCGTVKSMDMFEQARAACTQSNWQVPPQQPLQTIMLIMAGQQPLYDSQISLNNLLAHLEQDEHRKNVTYVLKNLVILDMIVEQHLFLHRIGNYNNSQLIYMETEGQTNKTIASIKDLIGTYHMYIKQKAKYYELQSKQLSQQRNRQSFMQKSNSVTMLNQVNYCFKIQNLILDANSKYKNGDKSSQLIQYIFSLLLKTYVFCHSIVTIALKIFAKRIPELSRYDLQYLKKFASFYNKDYVKNFTLFMSSNQSIPTFKNFQYKDLIVPDEKMLQLVQTQLQFIYDDPGIVPVPEELIQQKLRQMGQQNQRQRQKQRQKQAQRQKQKQRQRQKQKQKIQQNKTHDTAKQQQQILSRRIALSNEEVLNPQKNYYSDQWDYKSQQKEGTKLAFMDPADIFTYYGHPAIPQPEQQAQQQTQTQESKQKINQTINQSNQK